MNRLRLVMLAAFVFLSGCGNEEPEILTLPSLVTQGADGPCVQNGFDHNNHIQVFVGDFSDQPQPVYATATSSNQDIHIKTPKPVMRRSAIQQPGRTSYEGKVFFSCRKEGVTGNITVETTVAGKKIESVSKVQCLHQLNIHEIDAEFLNKIMDPMEVGIGIFVDNPTKIKPIVEEGKGAISVSPSEDTAYNIIRGARFTVTCLLPGKEGKISFNGPKNFQKLVCPFKCLADEEIEDGFMGEPDDSENTGESDANEEEAQ